MEQVLQSHKRHGDLKVQSAVEGSSRSRMKVSIIIATFNRCESLTLALNSLASMVVPSDVEWEVLLVDNKSTDSTKAVILQFVEEHRENFRYVFEGKQGKSHALNSAILQAQGDVVVLTDDDCIPDPGWLCAIVNEFTLDPQLSVLGGRVELYCKEDRPVSIRTSRERIPFSSPTQLFFLIPGCNLAIRKSVFDAVGNFDPLLGPGTRMQAIAEDSDFLYRAFKKGFKIVYSPDVLLYHNHGRRTDTQVQALNHKYVVGRGAFYGKHILRGDIYVLKMAYWEVSSLLKGLIRERFSGEAAQERKLFLRDLLVGAVYVPSVVCWRAVRGFATRLSP